MLQESDAVLHGRASSSVPATPSPKSSGSLNGASSNGATTSKTTRHLDNSEKNKQKEIKDLLKQFVDLFPGNKYIKAITIIFALLLTLFGDGYVGYLIHQYGHQHPSTQSIPTPTPGLWSLPDSPE